MFRNLPSMHPIFRLLEPYIGSSIYVNNYTRKNIIPKYVNSGFSVSIEGSAKLIEQGYRSYNFFNRYFPVDMSERGVDDTSKLPYYPYRDLGGVIFDPIVKMVSGFIKYYYRNSIDLIKKDSELMAFINSLTTEAKIDGVPKCNKVSHLVSIITHIIWISTVQYSILNGSQYFYNGFIPNMSPILNVHPPRPSDKVSMETILKALPDYFTSFKILCHVNLFSPNTLKTSKLLANFPDGYFKEAEILELFNTFRAELKFFATELDQHSFCVVSPSRLRIGWDI